MSGESTKPLAGLVVADLSRILAGPLCTMVLADLGADVIKIERPGTGDDTRAWGPPFVNGDAAYFLSINRNKRSIALDLGEPADLDLARQIIARSDVLVQNFRSGVMEKFGLSYEAVAAENPGLVYCSIPAFAFEDRRDLPGYDLLMQSLSGFMSITGELGGEPVKMGVALLDVVAGLYAAVGVLAALHERSLEGRGRHVEVGLFEASVASLVNQAANYLLGGELPVPGGNSHPNIVPYQAFRASDGGFVLAAANDKLFRSAAAAIGRTDLLVDARFGTNSDRVENRGQLTREMQTIFDSQPVDYWVDLFVQAGVPAAPVRNISEVFASPEGASTIIEVTDDARGDLRLVGSPIHFVDQVDSEAMPPPRLGEHGDEIRAWLDLEPPQPDLDRAGGDD